MRLRVWSALAGSFSLHASRGPSSWVRCRVVLLLVLSLFAVGLAGCVDDPPDDEADPTRDFGGAARTTFETGRAVVAVLDTGINPYHEAFQDPGRQWRANQTLPGYVSPWVLPLSLDAEDQEAALEADEAVWDAVQEGRLYDVPGTRIVGLVAFGQPAPGAGAPRIAPGLDEVGHGTATAGQVAAACPDCLIVAVEVAGATEARHALDWVRDQGWIDVVAYPARAGVGFVGAGVHHADPDDEAGFAWGRANAEAGQVVVVAAGNGWQDVSGTGATAYSPARDLSYHYWTSGPDWVLTVGAWNPESDGASTWHTYPVDILGPGLGCSAPHPFERSGTIPFDGTSCAAPTVAGQVGRVLAAVRDVHEDGATGPRSGQRLSVPDALEHEAVTREDLVRAFLLEARPVARSEPPLRIDDPTAPATWTTGDGVWAPPFAGWGVHDDDTLRAASARLVGDAATVSTPSEAEQAWFPVDQRIRLDLWGPWDRGATRVPYPEPFQGPVRTPGSATDLTALYEAVRATR